MPKPVKDKSGGNKIKPPANAPGMEKGLVDIPVPTVIEETVEAGSKGDESDDGKGGDGPEGDPAGEKGDDDEGGGGDVSDEPGFRRIKKRSSISAAGKTAEPKTPEESRLDAIVSMGLFSYAVL